MEKRAKAKEKKKEVLSIFEEHDPCSSCRPCYSSMTMLIFKKIPHQRHTSEHNCATHSTTHVVLEPKIRINLTHPNMVMFSSARFSTASADLRTAIQEKGETFLGFLLLTFEQQGFFDV